MISVLSRDNGYHYSDFNHYVIISFSSRASYTKALIRRNEAPITMFSRELTPLRCADDHGPWRTSLRCNSKIFNIIVSPLLNVSLVPTLYVSFGVTTLTILLNFGRNSGSI